MAGKSTTHACRIRKGDMVAVIAGEDRGQRGRVLRIITGKDRLVVEGVNLVHRHIRRSQKNPQGGRLRRESPIHISNVMVIDPETDEPTRIGRKQVDPSRGSLGWARVSKKSGNEIDAESAKLAKKKKSKGKKAKE